MPQQGERPLARFDRYFLAQLLMLFGLFALILVSIFWINRAVALFDLLISSGQSALVFLEFTTLSLPAMIRTNLPLAGVVAVIWVVNRMNNESEMVVVQATGFSPWQLARPVLVFSGVILLFLLALTHVLSPVSQSQLRDRQAEISSDMSARLLREGVFIHPARGVTFFIEEISPNGALSEVMLSDARDPGMTTTYTAARATLLRQEQATLLVLLDGLVQALETESGRLSTTRFDRFVYDVTTMAERAANEGPNPAQQDSLWLVRAMAGGGERAGLYRAHLHRRNGEALFGAVAATLAFAAMIAGHFSRFGMWSQIGWAIVLVVGAKALDNQLIARAMQPPQPVAYFYVAPAVALIVATGMMASAAGLKMPWRRAGRSRA